MGEYGLVGVCACQRKCSSMSACACVGTGRWVEMACGVTIVAPDLGDLCAGQIHFAIIGLAGGVIGLPQSVPLGSGRCVLFGILCSFVYAEWALLRSLLDCV